MSLDSDGWSHPSESLFNLSGDFVVPLTKKGTLRKKYTAIAMKYLGDGEWQDEEELDLISSSPKNLTLNVHGSILNFETKGKSLPYIGKLKHPDLSFNLIKIDTVDDMDKVHEATGGYILTGFRHVK